MGLGRWLSDCVPQPVDSDPFRQNQDSSASPTRLGPRKHFQTRPCPEETRPGPKAAKGTRCRRTQLGTHDLPRQGTHRIPARLCICRQNPCRFHLPENDKTGPQTSLAGLCRRRRDRSTSSRGPLVLFGYSKEHPVPDQNSRTGAGGLVIRARLRRLRLDPISTHRLTPLTGRQRHKVGDHLQTGSSALHLPEDCAHFRSFSYYHSSTWGQGRWAGIGAWP